MQYPHARQTDQTDDFHGTSVHDPYRWLEDTDSPETRAWIAAENALTESWLSGVPVRDAIRKRLTALWDHPRAGAPWRRGERWFQLRNTGLQNQSVLWTMPSPRAQGRVLLDPNAWSADGTAALSGLAVSRDGRRIAYARSDRGSDWMTWRVREVDAGHDTDDVVRWSKFSPAAWMPDGSAFYYGAYDPPEAGQAYHQANRNQRLCLHRVGTAQDADQVVYARPDEPEWGFSPVVSEDGRWLIVTVWQGTDPRNRLYVADLAGDGRVRPLLDDFDAAYRFVGSLDTTLYVLTDRQAPKRRVVAVDAADPRPERWREIVPQGEDAIQHAQLVGDAIVLVSLHHASHRLELRDLDGRRPRSVDLPDHGSIEDLTGRQADRALHYTLTTFTRPTEVRAYDLDSQRDELVFAPELDAASDDLVTEQVFVESRDGTRVPVFLVHRADVEPGRGPAPALLYGYGGFGISITPAFRSGWLAWVERGGVLAVANLRGGGEYGKTWHDAGRLANKQNTFDDALACAEWLVANGWTTPARLAIQGGSNGGLLAGACLTQRPDLFGAAVIEVGVLDMLRFHTFTIGWGWTSDYGTPDDREQFTTLYAYSPLHRLRPGTAYPATLLTTGDHDDRVVPGHSFKFAAALQAAQGGEAPVLIRIETSAGHGAGKPTAKAIDERTDVLAFLEHILGQAWGPGSTETCGDASGPDTVVAHAIEPDRVETHHGDCFHQDHQG